MKSDSRHRSYRATLLSAFATAAVGLWQAESVLPLRAQGSSGAAWRQTGGPDRNFIVPSASRLADTWPATGPRSIWSQPLGAGHSAILVEEGRLYTMYRPVTAGAPRSWLAEEAVVALNAATGTKIWEYKYPSKLEDVSQGSGPHSTPLLVGDRLFAFGTNLLRLPRWARERERQMEAIAEHTVKLLSKP